MKDQIASFLRRNSQTIPIIVIILCVGAILVMQAFMIGQLRNTTEEIKKSSEKTEKRIEQVDRHLDCIVYFFSRTNRDDKAIRNIETCQLQTDRKPSAVAPPQSQPVASQSPQSTPQPTATPQPAQPRSNRPTPPNRPVTPPSPEKPTNEPVTGIPLIDRVIELL